MYKWGSFSEIHPVESQRLWCHFCSSSSSFVSALFSLCINNNLDPSRDAPNWGVMHVFYEMKYPQIGH